MNQDQTLDSITAGTNRVRAILDEHGFLTRAHTDDLLKRVVQRSDFLSVVDFQAMASPVQKCSRISLSKDGLSRHSDVTMNTVAVRGEIPISSEILVRDGGDGIVLDAWAAAMAQDMTELVTYGDVSSKDPFLSLLNGAFAQAGRVLNKTYGSWNALANAMLAEIPKDCRSNVRWFIDQTFPQTDDASSQNRFPVVFCPRCPEPPQVLLTPPRNITVGVWNKLEVKVEPNFVDGRIDTILAVKFDVKLIDPSLAVRAPMPPVTE